MNLPTRGTPHRSAPWRARWLAAGLVSLAAAPAFAEALPEGTPASCGNGTWRFEDAPQASVEDASFNPAWTADLQVVVACLKDPHLARACVSVQGRFDDTRFEGPVGEAMGGQIAAQSLRARGRALRLVSWFHEAGVAPDRIRETPVPSEPSWRGAFVSLLPDCLPPAQAPQVAGPPDAEQVRVVVRETLAEQSATPGPVPEVHVEMAAPKDPPGPFWLAAGTGFGGLVAADADDAAVGLTRVGLGWTGAHTYARLDGGLTYGSGEHQSRGWETTLGGGWHALSWLDVGARAGHRVSGPAFTDPWSDQAFFGGAESTQCLKWVRGLSACAEEFLGGGLLTRRAVTLRDTLYYVPQASHGALLLGLNLALRQEF
jgi:hypothetical protein